MLCPQLASAKYINTWIKFIIIIIIIMAWIRDLYLQIEELILVQYKFLIH